MKFLCISCDQQMQFAERQEPGDGTFAASFRCPQCGHQVALLANPMETQLVGSLGIRIGGRTSYSVDYEITMPADAPLWLHNEFGNAVVGLSNGQHFEVNTTDTLIYSTTGRLITTAGLEGLIVVDTGDRLLICTKEHAQLVKEIAEHMQRVQQP